MDKVGVQISVWDYKTGKILIKENFSANNLLEVITSIHALCETKIAEIEKPDQTGKS